MWCWLFKATEDSLLDTKAYGVSDSTSLRLKAFDIELRLSISKESNGWLREPSSQTHIFYFILPMFICFRATSGFDRNCFRATSGFDRNNYLWGRRL